MNSPVNSAGLPEILPCISCGVCLRYCPKELDIPGFIDVYNEEMQTGYGLRAPEFVNSFPFERQPQNCSHCRMCEAVCPHKIKISEMMISLSDRVRRNPLLAKNKSKGTTDIDETI